METLLALIPIFFITIILSGVNDRRIGDIKADGRTYTKPNYYRFPSNRRLDIPSPQPTDPVLNGMHSDSIEGRYRRAAVAADSKECSTIGVNIMRYQGGSAIDAAIASTLCSGVVNPQSCGIGGGHFLVYYNRNSGQVNTVIGREQAPLAATADMFTKDKNTSSQTGGKSIAVPGEIRGLYEAWKLGGRLPWKQLFQPTINLCRNGITVGRALRSAFVKEERFGEEFPAFKDFITNPKTGEIYQEGEVMIRPLLAKTLEVIADEGPQAFYEGSLTDAIIADISEADGIIIKDDLAQYTAPVKQPVVFNLDEKLRVFSPPPPSSGAVYQFILNVLKGFHFDISSVSTVDMATRTWHRIVEAFKHAFSLRSELGDSDIGSDEFMRSVDELVEKMTDPDFGETTRARISDSQTFESSYYGPELLGISGSSMGTSHLSVLGPNGDAVSVTSTVNLFFGSKVFGTRTGIIFNDEMDDFSTPGTVNFFGVPSSSANFIVPGKRPLSSMSPSIIVDKWGDAQLVIGAAGGTRIITSTAQVTVETLLFNWEIKESIDYPRVHHQLFPPTLGVQQRFPQVLIDGLQGLGHNTTVDIPLSVVQGILRQGNQITANSDFRKGGEPDGF
ncbi:glutathione hydrolase 1 proenzyme-like [Mercenaria mercenaria]|uniref:glutathione hydrolase 1 proenzyme-like n=1 Tax=Mercenaria mercenaria TaxID=6596 RepID=UPI00234ECF83|nr:glutathione hydrolase 1 proenzyme-like [Mercenaria mercenaria]